MAKSNVDSLVSEAEELNASSASKPKIKNRSYLDQDTGFETFYVKNKGSTRLRFSKINLSIGRGEIMDLLTIASIEDLNHNPELRNFLSNGKKLVRLTKEEYEHEQALLEEMLKRKEQAQYDQDRRLAKAMSGEAQEERPIRPAVSRKVNMLLNFLGSDPAKAKTGMDQVSFCHWASTEDFQENEIDFIIGATNDSEIRSFMYKRKKELFG